MVLKQLFFKGYEKLPSGWGLSPQKPVNNTFELQYIFLHVSHFRLFRILTFGLGPPPENEFLVTYQHQATASDLPFYDIFAPTKNSSFEVSDDVNACDLGPPSQKSWLRLCANLWSVLSKKVYKYVTRYRIRVGRIFH